MSPRDIVLAVSVAVVWGLTFIAIKVGVDETSPLMLSALRFFFAAVPAVFFVAPPKTPAWKAALYGLLIGVGQFGLMFIAIGEGFPIGLTSLVVMAQVYFTILLAWVVLAERPKRLQLVGAGVAFAGMGLIGADRLAGASFGPFVLVVLAAFFWGAGTTRTNGPKLARQAGPRPIQSGEGHACHKLQPLRPLRKNDPGEKDGEVDLRHDDQRRQPDREALADRDEHQAELADADQEAVERRLPRRRFRRGHEKNGR